MASIVFNLLAYAGHYVQIIVCETPTGAVLSTFAFVYKSVCRQILQDAATINVLSE